MREDDLKKVVDLYWIVDKSSLSQTEMRLVDEVRVQYPFFVIPHYVKAKYSGSKIDLFSASTYAPNRILLQKYVQIDQFSVDSSNDEPTANEGSEREKAPALIPGKMDLFSIIDPEWFSEYEPQIEGLFTVISEEDQVASFPLLNFDIKELSWQYLYLVEEIRNQIKQTIVHRSQKEVLKEREIDNFLRHISSLKNFRPEGEDENGKPDPGAMASVEENDEIVSETLAKLHVRQGNYSEAVRIYEKLSLLFPEKNMYFADQIEKISNY